MPPVPDPRIPRVHARPVDVTAVDDGVRGKDHVVVDAGGDGIKADNDEDGDRGWVLVVDGAVSLSAGDDGVQAATDVLVAGGSVRVDAGATSGTGRGLQAGVQVAIDGGRVDVTAVDDHPGRDAGRGVRPGR